MQNNYQKLAEGIINELKKELRNCTTLDDYLALSYNFNFNNHSIAPLQIKEEIHALLKILDDRKPKKLLEIGTAAGGTLFLLTRVSDPEATIISIDMPEGKFGGEFYPNWKSPVYESFSLKQQKIYLLRSDSHQFATLEKIKKILGQQKLDFLLIDGDHSYEGVKKDFEMYSPFVAEGGIVAFHDVNLGPSENVGGVPQFWREIKSKYFNAEIIHNMEGESYGIGIIFILPKNTTHISSDIFRTISKLKEIQLEKLRYMINNNPLALLLSLYFKRDDLQKSFPQVLTGNLTSLINWASITCKKTDIDERIARQQLSRFASWYDEHRFEGTLVKKDELEQIQNNLKILQKDRDLIKDRLEQVQSNASALQKDRDLIKDRLEQVQSNASALEKERNLFRKELDMIHDSVTWRTLRKIDKITRQFSFVRDVKSIITASGVIIRTEGFDSFLSHSRNKIKRGEFRILSPQNYDLSQKKSKMNMQNMEILYNDTQTETQTYEQKFIISVVIPTNSDISSIMPTIERIKSQKGIKELQLILVNSGKYDLGYLSKVINNLEIIKINPKEFHHGRTRNLGASKAYGDFLIFLTDDAIPVTDHLFYDMCTILSKDKKIVAATAKQIIRSDSDMMYAFLMKSHYTFLGLDEDRIISTKNFDQLNSTEQRKMAQIDDVCACYSREVFSKFQYSEIDYAEDLDMGIRLLKKGYKIAQLASTGVIHSHNRPPSYYVSRGFVDNIWVAKLVDQEFFDYKKIGISNSRQIIDQGYHLYKSVSLTIDLLKQKPVNDIWNVINSVIWNKIPEFYNSNLTAISNDNSLDKLFSKFPEISSRKLYGEPFLVSQFIEMAFNFGNYLINSYPNLEGIENEFHETLYKICGWIIGNALGGFKVYSEKNNILLDSDDKNIESIVGNGV